MQRLVYSAMLMTLSWYVPAQNPGDLCRTLQNLAPGTRIAEITETWPLRPVATVAGMQLYQDHFQLYQIKDGFVQLGYTVDRGQEIYNGDFIVNTPKPLCMHWTLHHDWVETVTLSETGR